jgi:hypothetical protein
MAVNLSPYGGVGAQFLDNSGNVLTGGKIFTYSAGTTTNQATYTTSAGNVPHSNPIILDASGRVPSGGEIWLTDGFAYKFILRDANDVLIATYDNVTGINSNFVAFTNEQEIQTATAGQTIFNLTTITYQPATNSLSVFVDGVNQYGPGAQYAYVETDSDTVTFVNGLHVGALVKFTTSQLNSSASQSDAFQVSYTPPFTGSVATNVGDKLAQTVSVQDFGAVGDGVTDDTAAIQAAINSASNYGRIHIPSGTYKVTSTLVIDVGIILYGDGAQEYADVSPGKTVISYTGTGVAINVLGTGGEGKENIHLSDFSIIGNNSANGGIDIGTGLITKSSFINIFISGFKNSGTNLGYGIRLLNVYTTLFENVYTYKNITGLYFFGDTTTLNFVNCVSRQNLGDGIKVVRGNHHVLTNFISESNSGYGLNICPPVGSPVISWDFYSFYTENNFAGAAAQKAIYIGADVGSSQFQLFQIRFYGGSIVEAGNATTPAIELGICSNVWLYRTTVNTNAAYYIKVDPVNTSDSGFQSYASNFNNVTGSAISAGGVSNFQYIGNVVQGPIYFNPTQQVSNVPTMLDDYREGTFVPVYADAATGGNVATSVNAAGWYTKIGDVVTIGMTTDSINTSGLTAGNTLYIRGLPYAPRTPVFAPMQAIAASTTQPVALFFSGTTYTIQINTAGTLRAALVSDVISGTTNFFMTMTYLTA